MNRMFKWTIPALAALIMVVGYNSLAQADQAGANVTGAIKQGDAVVPGATVKLFLHVKHVKGEPKIKREPVATVQADANGNFIFPNVAPGEYSIHAHEKGFGHGHAKVGKVDNSDVSVGVIELHKHHHHKHEKPTTKA